MDWLEQLAIVLVLTFLGLGGAIITFLSSKVKRLEHKLNDETFERLKREAIDEIMDKSNSELVDDINKRYRGRRDSGD